MARTLTVVTPEWVQSDPHREMDTDSLLVTNGQAWDPGLFLKLVAGALTISSTSAASGVGADKISHYSLNAQTDPGGTTTKAYVGIVHPDDLWQMQLSTGTAPTEAAVNGQQYQLVTTSTTAQQLVAGTSHAVAVGVKPVWFEKPYEYVYDDVYGPITCRIIEKTITTQGA